MYLTNTRRIELSHLPYPPSPSSTPRQQTPIQTFSPVAQFNLNTAWFQYPELFPFSED